jgi:MoxR-like ATPase
VTALAELRERADSILAEVEKAIVGKRGPLELILLALLSDGHVLLEDYPGLAKTLIARSFAQATSLRFARIQFTPDLMPGDVTGSQIFDQRTTEFVFRPGPVFANLLLADEINRAPPKTQAALLEAMQERQVTIENTTHRLEPPFLVLATQNPIEYEGTYPLPEAQLDRFLVRISIGYPARDDEIEMLERRLQRGVDEVELAPVVDGATSRCTSPTRSRGTWSISSPRRVSLSGSRSARARAAASRSSSCRVRRQRSRGATS